VDDVLGKNGMISKMFDGYSERKSQIRLSKEIFDVYTSPKNLLAEAPTGIGKSLACLVPAALSTNYVTLVATATKSLQEQYYRKDLPFLRKVFGDSFTYTMLKGRSNYICQRLLNSKCNELLNSEYKDEISKIMLWAEKSEMGDMDELSFNVSPFVRSEIASSSDECAGKKCPFKETCFYYRQRERAQHSKVILVNIDLLCTDLVVKNKHSAAILPHYDVVIVDEAHELENIFSKYIGFKISEMSFANVAGSIINLINKMPKDAHNVDEMNISYEPMKQNLDKSISKIKKSLRMFFSEFEYERKPDGEQIFRLVPDDLTDTANTFGSQAIKSMEKLATTLRTLDRFDCSAELVKKMSSNVDTVLSITSRIALVLNEKEYDDNVVWVSYSKKDKPIIESAPIDVSPYLKEWLFTREKDWNTFSEVPKSVVLMSATLTANKSFDFMKQRLGISKSFSNDIYSDQTKEIILESDFDYKHNALLYLPAGMVDASGASKNKDTFTIQLAQNICRLASVTHGRMLCLFTSYSEMNKVYDIVKDKVPYKTFSQSVYPKKELISMFKENVDSMLFATSSFWTGVSFEGDTCSAVVIDRIPFPVPSDPIIEARIDKLKKQRMDWFGGYYLPMAILSMQQGFGRLIRTKTDMGVVMICDKRIITKGYGSKFIRSFPRTLQTSSFKKVKFFFDIVEKKRRLFARRS
jgi:ATP-dependent DNA helicase DinG